MDRTTLIIIAIVIVVAVIGVTALLMRGRRTTQRLSDRFGPEYDRTLEESGRRAKAEAELHDREKRVEALAIRPLAPADRERYIDAWAKVQAEFVDNPATAVAHADQLLGEVMATRGYPVGDFEQRAADISVDHPVVVQNYRAGHEIALRHASGETSTEDLRQAMIHYRALFDELAGEAAPTPATAAATA
jgi:hypothetical protein